MLISIGRIAFGFTLACLAAAAVKVAFAVGVQDVLTADANRLKGLGRLIAQFATVFGVFSCLFVLLATAIAEWQGIRSVFFYVFVGMVIAATAFAAQYLGEAPSADTVLNNYGIAAFLVTGFTGGLAYWLISGRYAGGDDGIYRPVLAEVRGPLPVAPGNHARASANAEKS